MTKKVYRCGECVWYNLSGLMKLSDKMMGGRPREGVHCIKYNNTLVVERSLACPRFRALLDVLKETSDGVAKWIKDRVHARWPGNHTR